MLLFVHFYVQIGNVLLAIGPLLCGIDFVWIVDIDCKVLFFCTRSPIGYAAYKDF